MAGKYTFEGDPLMRRAEDKGYRIGWKYKYDFGKGHLEGSMTFGEAQAKAAELSAKEPEKVFWPELILEPAFEHYD